jgi:ADP-heptose:LPS heptosyltransferase
MHAQNILIIHQGAIGDLILSLPAFHAIRSAFPKAFIEVMGYPDTLSIIHNRFYADAVSSVNRIEVTSLYSSDKGVHPDLITFIRRFGSVFLFGGDAQKGAMQKLAAFHPAELVCIKPFPETGPSHVIDFQLEQLKAYGYAAPDSIPRFFLCEKDREEAKNFLAQQTGANAGHPLIAVHPGSGSRKKNWSAGHYAVLIRELYQSAGGTILIIEGPADRQCTAALLEEIAGIRPVMAQSPALPVLAAMLLECSLFVGNDSGITHLAAAAGIPVVALFGPSDPRIWGPRGEKVRLLKSDATAVSETDWITPAAVVEAAQSMLGCRRLN